MTYAKRVVGLIVVVSVVFLAPATASAARTHSVSVTAYLAQVRPAPNPVTAGPATGFGTDALLVTRGAITGTALKGRLRAYNTAGSATATFSLAITIAPGGAATFAGTATVTGGTGRYRHATGHLTINGSTPSIGAVATFHAQGTLRY